MVTCDKCDKPFHMRERPYMLNLIYDYLDFQSNKSAPDLCFDCQSNLHKAVNQAIDKFLGREGKECE